MDAEKTVNGENTAPEKKAQDMASDVDTEPGIIKGSSLQKSVNMTFKALYSFILNTNVRNPSGVIGIMISLLALFWVIYKWNFLASNQRVAFIVVALIFTVINPLLLAFKAFKQLKLNPAYKKPLVYDFTDTGIGISQGEAAQSIKWENVCRLMKTKSMIAIYTSRIHAFVIPLSELGDDTGKILSKVVSFTSEYKPVVSRSLKQYQSGKGL
jgi:hypothetical protein